MNLKEFRDRHSLTQIELAKALDVSINTIIKWENEVSKPNADNRHKLQKYIKNVERSS